MKRMLAFLFVLVVAFASFACAEGAVTAKVDYSAEKETVIAVSEADGKATLIDAMKELKADEKLSFESSTSTYGEFITAVGGVEAGATEFWAIYTTDTESANTDISVAVDGRTYYQAMLGASSLVVKKGERYLLRLESWA